MSSTLPTQTATPQGIDIRRLTYADLPQVVAVERRAFPTPWSLAMFVLELSKPGGCCLAALRDGELVGYLICSRFDTVFHVMNVAVDPDLRRQGIGRRLLETLLETIGDPEARYTSRCGPPTWGHPHLRAPGLPVRRATARYYQDNGEDAMIMWRTPATRPARRRPQRRAGESGLSEELRPGGLLHYSPGARSSVHAMSDLVLAIETSCDDTCAAVVTGEGILSNVISSQGSRPLRRRRPRGRARQHLDLLDPVIDDALARAGVSSTTSSWWHRALASSARCSSGCRRPRRSPPRLAAGPSTICRATSPPPSCRASRETMEPLRVPGRQRQAHLPGSSPSATATGAGPDLDDAAGRRSTGARLLGLPYPGGPALERLARDGGPGLRLPHRPGRGGLDSSFSGVKTAALRRARPGEDEAARRRRPGRLLPAGHRRGARRALRAGAGADGPLTVGRRGRQRALRPAWPSSAPTWPCPGGCAPTTPR